MGRGVSSGGGQSSLGYLFGGGDIRNTSQSVGNPNPPAATNNQPSHKHLSASSPIDKQIPAGIHGNPKNNYYRVDGQNCGNFLTVCVVDIQFPHT